MKELLDKFQRDRWVEVLTDLTEGYGGTHCTSMSEEEIDTIKEVTDYLKGKEVKSDV